MRITKPNINRLSKPERMFIRLAYYIVGIVLGIGLGEFVNLQILNNPIEMNIYFYVIFAIIGVSIAETLFIKVLNKHKSG